MNELHYLSITELALLLQQREISSHEITQSQLNRIAALDPELHAYTLVTAEQALREAQHADQEIGQGTYRSALHGVPIALKDLYCTRGIPTTGGTTARGAYVPSFDATVVARLRDAGAILLGKLNLAEGAMAGYGEKFAAPINPWNRSISPGGSSSGSGVATAAGLCFGSLGTDTGGSIRFPASMCGVVGAKPTWGRISRHGVLDLAPSMDHVGTLTRSVGDAAIMIDAIAGYDKNDPSSLSTPAPDLCEATSDQVSNLRIGYAKQYASQGVDSETVKAVESAVAAFASRGATIVDVEIPALDRYIVAWRDICASEALLAHRQFFPSRSTDYGPWFRSWLEHGAACSGADYAHAHQLRTECNAVIARAFADIDVLLCPAMASPEPRKSDAQFFSQTMGEFSTPRQRFTIPYNFNGAPCVTIPAGLNSRDEPISVQCVGRPGRDDLVFNAAAALEQMDQNQKRHPPL
jgi:amidase